MKNKVKECRKSKGWSQEDLALKATVSQSAISDIEREKYVPRVDVALLIARALQSTVEELFIIENRKK